MVKKRSPSHTRRFTYNRSRKLFEGAWNFGGNDVSVSVITSAEEKAIKRFFPDIVTFLNDLSRDWKSTLKCIAPKIERELFDMKPEHKGTKLYTPSFELVYVHVNLNEDEDEEDRIGFNFAFDVKGVLSENEIIHCWTGLDRKWDEVEYVFLD